MIFTDPLNLGGFGYYSVFKLFYDKKDRPYKAFLFCFYDGDGDSPQGFKDIDEACDFMESMNKYEVTYEI